MITSTSKSELTRELQKQVLSLQGFKKPESANAIYLGLPEIEKSFPYKTFPTSAIHEFVSRTQEDSAATNAFISGILHNLISKKGICIWVSNKLRLFPPGLTIFGVDPERFIFLETTKTKEALWAIEESLKCEAISAVVGEITNLSFTESRRLQLAVEESKVTGFIHRRQLTKEQTTACVTRWRIQHLPSISEDGLPGVGYPKWNVQLQKVRNGRPGQWEVAWSEGGFRLLNSKQHQSISTPAIRKSA
jgi:protein ImuA